MKKQLKRFVFYFHIVLMVHFCDRRFWKLWKIVLCLQGQLIWLRYENTYNEGGGNHELVLG